MHACMGWSLWCLECCRVCDVTHAFITIRQRFVLKQGRNPFLFPEFRLIRPFRHRRHPMGKGQAQRVPDFDLATACTKKEGRKLTKMECMVNYHLARVPFWNGKDSMAMKNAEKTRDMIDNLKTKVKSRWEESHGIY
mmetsp:Transcript_595/g.1758  ORF Transcript_595/g.1758 Transcript_595/m.1758 type:complete len:137 (-) Transcript_595:563-973(-)